MITAISSSVYSFGEQISSITTSLARRIWSAVMRIFQFIAHLFSSPKPMPLWTNEKRAQVSQQILQAIEKGGYSAFRETFIMSLLRKLSYSNAAFIPLQPGNVLSQKSQVVTPSPASFPSRSYETQFRVVSQDCLELAQEYVRAGHKTAVLIFASPIEPGGGFTDGTNGQEEHICYRSEMAGFFQDQLTNENSFYRSPAFCDPTSPLYQGIRQNIFHPGGLIHTPDVLVFRESQAKGFSFMNNPFKVGMLTSPAPVNPDLITLENGKVDYTSDEARDKVRTTLRTQLQAAYSAQYEAVVLGAFGCGAFQNPPDAIAKLYREVIDSDFSEAFKHIGFAILNDPYRGKHNPRGNLLPFQEVFN